MSLFFLDISNFFQEALAHERKTENETARNLTLQRVGSSEAYEQSKRRVRYSLCSTTYNCGTIVGKSVESILRWVNPEEMEFIVCDSQSTDGTPQQIKRFSHRFKKMKIVSRKCTRGEGRQIAFQNSTGEYIIRVDLDTIYNRSWGEFLRWHSKHLPSFAIETYGSGIFPRKLVEHVGGWKRLNRGEDIDMCFKLAMIGKIKWSTLITGYNMALLQTWERIPNPIEKWVRQLIELRDFMALHIVTLRKCVRSQRYHPFMIFFDLVARIYALSLAGVINVRKCGPNIVKNNLIELPIEGVRGNERWWRWDLIVLDRPLKSQVTNCVVCGYAIPLWKKYCSKCLVLLKKEPLLRGIEIKN